MTDRRYPVSFIATNTPDAARAFYKDVLGLALIEHSDFALVFEDSGHTLRIQIVPDAAPPAYTVHGWVVPDITAEVRALTAKGVTFQHHDSLPQDALGIWTTPDGHKIAWFTDPGGNTLSLTQYNRPESHPLHLAK